MDVWNPNRVTRTYTQRLVAAPPQVFPLLCPVREADWIEGWDPLVVLSQSGVAEPDCVFLTEATPANAIWYVTTHDAKSGHIEMVKITPSVTACRLRIRLRAVEGGSEATVSYTHTSLGPAGDAFVASFTQDTFRQFMRDWEDRINYYLSNGQALRKSSG